MKNKASSLLLNDVNLNQTYSNHLRNKNASIKRKTNLKSLLKQLITNFSSKPDTYIELDGYFPEVNVEEEKLKKVFYNLLTNAVKYNYKNKCLVGISGWEDEDYFYFDVADNGMGIDKKDLNNIFYKDSFPAKNDRFGKTGLGNGLKTVKQILENFGGKITVRSKKGTGSLFQVALPRTLSIIINFFYFFLI